MNRRTAWIALLVSGLLAPQPASGTLERMGTGVNPADLGDPRAFLINPALATLGDDQFATGLRVLHAGLLDDATALNSGYAVFSGSRTPALPGISLGVSYLSTPLWGVREVTAGYGRRIMGSVALGLRLGFNWRGFDKSKFRGVDTNDDVLANSLDVTVPVGSIGLVYANPFTGLTAGLVLDNPHQPNVSIDDDPDARLEMAVRAGLHWERRTFGSTVSLFHDDEENVGINAGGRYYMPGRHALQGWVSNERWTLGLRFAVNERFTIDYGYTQPFSDLASESAGSHDISIWFRAFGDVGTIEPYQHRDPLDDTYDYVVPESIFASIPKPEPMQIPTLMTKLDLYHTGAPRNTVTIRTKRLERHFLNEIDRAILRRMPRWRIGVMDSTWSDKVIYKIDDFAFPGRSEEVARKGEYTEDYVAGLKEMGRSAGKESGRVKIIAGGAELPRASYLAKEMAKQGDREPSDVVQIYQLDVEPDSPLEWMLFALVGDDSIPLVEEITLFELRRIPFPIQLLGGGERPPKSWTLNIRDSELGLVRSFQGTDAPPDTIWWDWRANDGKIIGADVYTYRFGWESDDGTRFNLPPQELVVRRLVHHVDLKFMKRPTADVIQSGKSTLYLDSGQSRQTRFPATKPKAESKAGSDNKKKE